MKSTKPKVFFKEHREVREEFLVCIAMLYAHGTSSEAQNIHGVGVKALKGV